ncbi:MAG: hypothetical protein JWO98_2007 [Frankiales bacterium]|nr:hypothetical protein [Frankiales bacterium]
MSQLPIGVAPRSRHAAAGHASVTAAAPLLATTVLGAETGPARSSYRLTALVHRPDGELLLRVAALLHRRHVTVVELTWHLRPNLAEEGELAGDVTAVFQCAPQQARVVLAGFVHMVGLLRPTLREDVPGASG